MGPYKFVAAARALTDSLMNFTSAGPLRNCVFVTAATTRPASTHITCSSARMQKIMQIVRGRGVTEIIAAYTTAAPS